MVDIMRDLKNSLCVTGVAVKRKLHLLQDVQPLTESVKKCGRVGHFANVCKDIKKGSNQMWGRVSHTTESVNIGCNCTESSEEAKGVVLSKGQGQILM